MLRAPAVLMLAIAFLIPTCCAAADGDDARGSAKQDAPRRDSAGKSSKSASKDESKGARSKGRLPRYYAEVVDDEQREKIYAVQEPFQTQIDELEATLEQIKAERDKAIRAVLTPEQRKKIDAMKAEKSKAGRRKSSRPTAASDRPIEIRKSAQPRSQSTK